MMGRVVHLPDQRRRWWRRERRHDQHELEGEVMRMMIQNLFGTGLYAPARARIMEHLRLMNDERQETECSYPDMADGSGE